MPVEIRELIIKTEIRSSNSSHAEVSMEDLEILKIRMFEECQKMIANSIKRRVYQR